VPEGIELSVEDDGRGLVDDWSWQALRRRHRFGLLGIVERSQRHGGAARVDPHSAMGGCRVVVRVPTGEVSV
jgi:signal transduction histidine kinase